MVVLQREAVIGPVATFDADLKAVEGFDVIEHVEDPAPEWPGRRAPRRTSRD